MRWCVGCAFRFAGRPSDTPNGPGGQTVSLAALLAAAAAFSPVRLL